MVDHLAFGTRHFVLLLFCWLLCGCGMAELDEKARREFMAENPAAIVKAQFVGEGDFDNAYMHVVYTDPGSVQEKEVMWLYQRNLHDDTWAVTRKSEEKPPGSYFGD